MCFYDHHVSIIVLCEELRSKLDARGFNDRRYIKKHIAEYEVFMGDQKNLKYTKVVSDAHLRSGGIIEAYKAGCVTLGAQYRKGKKRIFSECYTVNLGDYATPPCAAGGALGSTTSGSNGSSGSSSSSSSSSGRVNTSPVSFNPYEQPCDEEGATYGSDDEEEIETQKDEFEDE